MVCLFVCSVCLTVQRNLERSVEGSSVLRRDLRHMNIWKEVSQP